MSGSVALIRLAAAFLPRSHREVRREEWLADLAGADELGIPRAQVAVGALRAALSEGVRVRAAAVTRRRALVVAGIVVGAVVVAAPVAAIAAMLASDARGVVTVEVTEDGDREVFWRDYPGVPELDPDDVLAGPTLEEGEAAGRVLMDEIESALTTEFRLEWAAPPTGNGDQVAFPAQNYYGGESMLRTLNVPGRQSTTVPTTWPEKERVLEIIVEVAGRHGYTDLTLDHETGDMSDEDLVESFGSADPEKMVTLSGMLQGSNGQWLSFGLQDLSLDVDGRFVEQSKGSEEYGVLSNSISLMYGANALLPNADRAEFEQRLAPYVGLERPEPLPS